jgi:hypothetical protein
MRSADCFHNRESLAHYSPPAERWRDSPAESFDLNCDKIIPTVLFYFTQLLAGEREGQHGSGYGRRMIRIRKERLEIAKSGRVYVLEICENDRDWKQQD